MDPFKFFTNNEVRIPLYYSITEEDIISALNAGREYYLNGNGVEDNPYHTPELFEAFNEGWDLEYSYDILTQARDRAFNNDNI
jgi:hypothetical protein